MWNCGRNRVYISSITPADARVMQERASAAKDAGGRKNGIKGRVAEKSEKTKEHSDAADGNTQHEVKQENAGPPTAEIFSPDEDSGVELSPTNFIFYCLGLKHVARIEAAVVLLKTGIYLSLIVLALQVTSYFDFSSEMRRIAFGYLALRLL